jgi:NADH dehydrogenase
VLQPDGTLASRSGKDGQPLPQVAQVAIQGGRHAARQVARLQRGELTKPFAYHDHGTMATIGRRDAVAQLPGGITMTGTFGWLAWLGVHLVFLVGFRNRAVVLVSWAYNYLTWDRSARLILEWPSHTSPAGVSPPSEGLG